MKKLTAILLTATMLLSLMAGTVAEDSRSQYADIADALAVLRALVGLENDACVTTHDFNENDVLDIGDALLVLRGLVGVGDMMVIRTGEVSEVVESSATTRVTERTTEATTTTEVTTTEPPVEPPETLSDEMRERIKADFLVFFDFLSLENSRKQKHKIGVCCLGTEACYPLQATLSEYFGTFNDKVVLKLNLYGASIAASIEYEIVAGHKIYYSGCMRVLVWNDGVFRNLTQAYEMGWLTADDIRVVSQRCRRC